MSLSSFLFSYRKMILTVFIYIWVWVVPYINEIIIFTLVKKIVRFCSSSVNKIFCHVGVFIITCNSGKFHKCKFNFFMSWNCIFVFFGVEYITYKVSVFLHYIKKLIFAGYFIICDGGFDKMACCVEFVAFFQIAVLFAGMKNGKVSVYISVFLLCFSDKFDSVIGKFFKCFIWFIGKRVCYSFKPFS